ncbi:MAG: ComF family protein [Clostridia bacterium]|nr:ComF family protein [Clostridia bacterium]
MTFPSPCLICGRRSESGLCAECRANFERAKSVSDAPVLFSDGAYTLFDYSSPTVKRLIFSLKTRGLRGAARVFSDAVFASAKAIPREIVCVTFLPRRSLARKRSGVDQAELLARAIARKFGLPCLKLLRRRGVSRTQHGLSFEKRQENVRGKFAATKTVSGIRGAILLVDDIITTGASATEACRTLREAGARRIYVLAMAKGGSR